MHGEIANGIEDYTNILALDASQVDAARAAWKIIEPQMPDLVEWFYDHLFARHYGAKFEGVDLPRLKAAQQDYWRTLFAGNFDAAYEAHVNRINAKHQTANVQLSHYIAAYAWFSERFFRIIAREKSSGPYRRDTLIIAVNKIMYLDMMIASGSKDFVFVD